MSKDDKQKISILLLGNSFVGKTSITKNFASGKFSYNMMNTVGVDYTFKTLKINNKNYHLKIWDTAGQERFQHVSRQFVRKAEGIIFVYDITNYQTFTDIIDCYKVCQDENNLDNIASILVGNKSDLEDDREVPYETAKTAADSLGFEYMEMSALNGENVEEGFTLLVKQILKIRKGKQYGDSTAADSSITLDSNYNTADDEDNVNNDCIKKCAC